MAALEALVVNRQMVDFPEFAYCQASLYSPSHDQMDLPGTEPHHFGGSGLATRHPKQINHQAFECLGESRLRARPGHV
jgi:hypothetical protein